MKLASKLKLDGEPSDCCPLSVATHLLQQVDRFLSSADEDVRPAAFLQDLNALARKLGNPKLSDQCKVLHHSIFFLI